MKEEKKRGAERTQKAVRDEWWTDERIQSYLALESSSNENPDFHILSKAYQGMVPESFARFITLFLEAGKDINATDSYGQTIKDVMQQHRHSGAYLQALEATTTN